MDGDEALVQALSLVVAIVWWLKWYARLLRPRTVGGPSRAIRWGAMALPPLFLAGLSVALRALAAIEVREGGYLLLFVALGAVWLGGAIWVAGLLGIHAVDDAIDRNNAGATIACAGAGLGLGTAYAFANFGEGPTIWTTIGPALLASGGCCLLWLGYQLVSGAADAIAIGRDVASGIRFGGMAVATGLILGRAVAGDWESEAGTWRDFVHHGWPALPLVVLAVVVQRRLRPTAERPRPPLRQGVVPAFVYLALSGLDLLMLGSWAEGKGAS